MEKLKVSKKKILLIIVSILLCVATIGNILLFNQMKLAKVVFADEPVQQNAVIYKMTGLTASNTDRLTTEIALTRGGAELEEAGVVYEGEYIKYNFRITNTTEENIEGVRIVASIPDGAKYGELNSNFEEFRQSYFYTFDEELTEKTIELGTIEAGKSKEVFYEVKVKDLPEGEEEKAITTNVSSYIGEDIAQSYEIKNVVKPANAQMFLGSFTEYGGKHYGLNIKSDTQEETEVKIHFPKGFKLNFVTYMKEEFEELDRVDTGNGGGELVWYGLGEEEYTIEDFKVMLSPEELKKFEELEAMGVDVYELYDIENQLASLNNLNNFDVFELSEDNILTVKLKTNHTYYFEGDLDETKEERNTQNITDNVIAYVETTENGYMSNENRMEVSYQDVEVSITSSNAGKKVKYEEEIDYEIAIKNTGKTNAERDLEMPSYIYVNVLDFMPEEINPISITYNNWTLVKNEDLGMEQKFYLEETEENTKSISGKRTDEEGNTLANIDVPLIIPSGETVIIKVKAKAGFVYEETTVENAVTVKSDEMIQDKISNKVSHTILPYNYENPGVPDNPDIPDVPDNPDVPDVPDNPDNPDNPNKPDTPNVPDTPNNDDKQQTKDKICDFKIDKYISKVTVKTASGVKEYNYENENLVKTEIKAKEINGATVTVNYKIVVTNIGDVAGTVGKIADKLPSGFAISDASNKNWPRDSKGEFINTSKANLRIDPGESTTLEVSATKQMTSETVGNFINEATIKTSASVTGLQDSNSQNDTSRAELIISISTGIYVYIAIIISILAVLISIFVYLVKKGKLKIGKFAKTTFLMLIFTSTLIGQISSNAFDAGEKHVHMTPLTEHSWSSKIGVAECLNGGIISSERRLDS